MEEAWLLPAFSDWEGNAVDIGGGGGWRTPLKLQEEMLGSLGILGQLPFIGTAAAEYPAHHSLEQWQ